MSHLFCGYFQSSYRTGEAQVIQVHSISAQQGDFKGVSRVQRGCHLTYSYESTSP